MRLHLEPGMGGGREGERERTVRHNVQENGPEHVRVWRVRPSPGGRGERERETWHPIGLTDDAWNRIKAWKPVDERKKTILLSMRAAMRKCC